MLNPGSSLRALLDAPIRPGRVEWLGLRPARHAAIAVVEQMTFDPAAGVVGDHWSGRPGGNRQVSLMAREHLAAIAACLGRDSVAPELLRRNVVLSGINLLALKERRFQLGGAVLETTGECHPCCWMERLLGTGGYNAVRGHGGILARVVSGGTVRIGDALARL